MSIHDTGRRVPEEAAEFRVPVEAGSDQDKKIQHRVGDEYANQFGPIGEEDFEQAKAAGWIDENNQLTARGVTQLESRKPETGEKPKYAIGDAYKDWWGPADDFNRDYLDAKENGWIDENNYLTEEGVKELARRDSEQKKARGSMRESLSSEGKGKPMFKASYRRDKPDAATTENIGQTQPKHEQRPMLHTSMHRSRETAADLEKKLADQFANILEEKGFENVTLIVTTVPSLPGTPRTYNLKGYWKQADERRGRKGETIKINMKEVQGTEADLVKYLEKK